MTPTYWGWCGCTVWPLVMFNHVGRCGRCGQKPIFIAPDRAVEIDGLTKDEAEALLESDRAHYEQQLEEFNS